uniref:Cadherin domain-containing protein n=1 Tax=Monodelphis domestica TaxID=13616 RepID=K7E2R2_MONDO
MIKRKKYFLCFYLQLFDNVCCNKFWKYTINGPGVDEDPIGLFSIEDNHTGKIYVHYPIDREKTPFFLLRVNIVDCLTQKIVERSLFLHVEIGDINDNPPQFAKEKFDFILKNNYNLDHPIFQIVAVDLDKKGTPNSKVTYSLVSQVPSLKGSGFHINDSNGEIYISGCLNYEVAQLFKLLIRASDHGKPPLSSTATINIAVEDGNNHMPVFIKGNAQIQQNVLRLFVQDHDSPFTSSWKVKYKILHGNEGEHFNIVTDTRTNEGILNVIKPLDCENLMERKLVIEVENEEPFSTCEKGQHGNGMVSTATVTVEVTGTNDFPQFHPPMFTVQELDCAKPGTLLGRYNATDQYGNTKNIRFKLVHDPADWVTVDEFSGVVTTVKHVDRESPHLKNSFYTIMVIAIDDCDPPQTSTGTMMLFLSDKNDNTPTPITHSMKVCNTEEKIPILVKAVDKDLDPFLGPFTFELDDPCGNIKNTWKLGQKFDYYVELLMSKSLQNGNYRLPLIIWNKQGFLKKQILYIRLHSCSHGSAHAEPTKDSQGVGGNTVLLICVSFISFSGTLIFLLWYSFGFAQKRPVVSFVPEQGIQTLIKYNEESENFLTTVIKCILMFLFQASI